MSDYTYSYSVEIKSDDASKIALSGTYDLIVNFNNSHLSIIDEGSKMVYDVSLTEDIDVSDDDDLTITFNDAESIFHITFKNEDDNETCYFFIDMLTNSSDEQWEYHSGNLRFNGKFCFDKCFYGKIVEYYDVPYLVKFEGMIDQTYEEDINTMGMDYMRGVFYSPCGNFTVEGEMDNGYFTTVKVTEKSTGAVVKLTYQDLKNLPKLDPSFLEINTKNICYRLAKLAGFEFLITDQSLKMQIFDKMDSNGKLRLIYQQLIRN